MGFAELQSLGFPGLGCLSCALRADQRESVPVSVSVRVVDAFVCCILSDRPSFKRCTAVGF